ncbi:MAG: Holliday junction resolvase RuvX [Oscillospiraceae bacterium]|nr:Holliday junction resolvase RuvX [Oscillospiraceae bacterium]
MRILAVDYGESRTGIAVCDPTEFLASPVGIITEKGATKTIRRILELCEELGAEMIVVGHPLNMNDSVGERAQKCEYIASRLREESGLEVVLWDERATTIDAQEILDENGVYRKKRKKVLDAVAAVLILESFMRSRKDSLGKTEDKAKTDACPAETDGE